MILKTYSRIFTNDAEETLKAFLPLHREEPHLRLKFQDWDLIGIGDILIVGGTDESLEPIRDSHGPFIVEDADETLRLLEQAGAEITIPMYTAPTGRGFFARNADGTHVEYVQWTPDLVETFIRQPQRAGKLASEL